MGRQTDEARFELRGAAVNGGGDVGVDLDVDARIVRVGAECVRRFGADALELEVGHCDGDGVDRGAEPCRERAGGRQRAVGKVRAVERDEDRAVDGLGSPMGGGVHEPSSEKMTSSPRTMVRASATQSATRNHAGRDGFAGCEPVVVDEGRNVATTAMWRLRCRNG